MLQYYIHSHSECYSNSCHPPPSLHHYELCSQIWVIKEEIDDFWVKPNRTYLLLVLNYSSTQDLNIFMMIFSCISIYLHIPQFIRGETLCVIMWLTSCLAHAWRLGWAGRLIEWIWYSWKSCLMYFSPSASSEFFHSLVFLLYTSVLCLFVE